MEGVRGEMMRRPTLPGHMAAAVNHPPANLRRLLRLGDDDDDDAASRPGHTLGSVLGFDKLPAARIATPAPTPSRTLLDIIREEETQSQAGPGRAPERAGSGDEHRRISWRSVKNRLLLRRMGSIPAARPAAEEPVRVSLINLLEESEGQTAGVGEEESPSKPTAAAAAAAAAAEGGEYRCCVCMVRHKGAAFIPCGHTFCRVCSRELWVSRGNCPLCNGYILEILDIF